MPIQPLPENELVIRELPEDERLQSTAPRGFLGIAKNVGQQFISGLDDVTSLLARPFELALPTVTFNFDGSIETLSPEETTKRRQAGLLGIPGRARREPRGLFEGAARLGGATLAAGPIVGRLAGLVSRPVPAVTKLGRLKQFPRKAAAEAGQRFAAAPATVTAVEAVFGATAGAGGFVATQIFPDSDPAKLVGEILGGTLPALTPTGLAIRASGGVKRLAQIARRPFTEIGGRRRAAARAKRAVPAERRGKALEELDLPTTIDPKTGKPVLTPGQRTGDLGFLSLERAVMESSEELVREADIQLAQTNAVILASLKELGREPTTAAIAPFKDKVVYLDTLMDTRVRIAAQRIDERITEFGPKLTREEANRIAEEEIKKALTAARAQREQLFAVIPDDTATPFESAKATYDSFLKKLGKPERGDVPAIARRFLDSRSEEFFGTNLPVGFRKNETRIRDLRGLSSKLREVARNSRAGETTNLNRARIADEIADSIIDDLANARAGPEVAEALAFAVDFSRKMADRFNKGTVGKLLGRRVAGDPQVPASLTLEASIGVGGPKAREALDGIARAFNSPEAPGSAVVAGAVDDFMRSKFLKQAVQQGNLSVKAAQNFLSKNEEILKRLPSLRRQINEVIESGEKLAVVQRQRNRVSLDDPRVSKAIMLIERGPVEAFRQISRLKPEQATREVQQLVNRVNRDSTGEALAGLKSGFVEFILTGARGKVRDINGLPFVSGFSMRDALIEPGTRAAANRLFSKQELIRLGTITRDLIRLEKRLAVKLPKEGILGDRPSKMLEAAAGIAGAAFGRVETAKLGIGGTVQIPGIFANRFRDLLNSGVKDPASRLIRDAVFDEDLFKELLMAPLEQEALALSKQATQKLNAWAAGVLAEHGAAVLEENEAP